MPALDVNNRCVFNTLGNPGKGMDPISMAYENLANAIVYTAVRDYQHALINLHFNPNDWKAKSRQKEVLSFFRSSFYRALTNIDSGYLIRVITDQVIERGYKRFYMGYGD